MNLLPILSEFDLDIPYLNREGSKEDYEKNWKERRMRFRDEVRCVASLLERNFEKYKTEDCWKVLVECVEDMKDNNNEHKLVGGVSHVKVGLNIDYYFNLHNYEKKLLIYKLLEKGINIVIKEKEWDKKPFQRMYQKVSDCNYNNQWIWNKPKKSPNRKYIAEVSCEHNIDNFKVSIIIKNKAKEIVKEEKIIEERPNEWAFAQHFGSLKWFSSNEVALIDKKGINTYSIQI